MPVRELTLRVADACEEFTKGKSNLKIPLCVADAYEQIIVRGESELTLEYLTLTRDLGREKSQGPDGDDCKQLCHPRFHHKSLGQP